MNLPEERLINMVINEEDEQNESSRIEQATLDLNMFAEQEDTKKTSSQPLMLKEAMKSDIFTLIRSQLCELVHTLADYYKKQ